MGGALASDRRRDAGTFVNAHQTASGLRASGLSAPSILAILRRRRWVLVLTFVMVVGATVAYSLLQEEKYSATSSLLFRDPQLDQQLFGSTFLEESGDPAREAATNVSLVSLDVVADRTADEVAGVTGSDVGDQVEVTAEGVSDLVSVTASDPNPRLAATLANTFANEYVEFRREADRKKIHEARRLVENELAQLKAQDADDAKQSSLRKRLEELTVLESLQTGNAEVVQEAAPPDVPSSPNLTTNTVLAAAVGLMLGVALALLVDRIDRRVREPDEIGEILDRPVLGVVPSSDAIPREGSDVDKLPPGVFESFRMIRANLRYFNASSEIRSIVVTSAESGDGKTTVAWNLAAAGVSAGANVVLVEADLRRPALQDRLRRRSGPGLSHVLAGATRLDDAVAQVPITGSGDDGNFRSVDVIFAGAIPPNPTDLMESQRMDELLRSLVIRYDAVYIDTPPVSVVSDAIPLLTKVDGVLVVSRLNQTTRDGLARLAGQLDNVKARTLGVVVNAVSSSRRGYGYGYDNEYGATTQRPGARSADAIGARGPGHRNGEGIPPQAAQRSGRTEH